VPHPIVGMAAYHWRPPPFLTLLSRILLRIFDSIGILVSLSRVDIDIYVGVSVVSIVGAR